MGDAKISVRVTVKEVSKNRVHVQARDVAERRGEFSVVEKRQGHQGDRCGLGQEVVWETYMSVSAFYQKQLTENGRHVVTAGSNWSQSSWQLLT